MAIQLKDRVYTNCTTIGKADIQVGATKEGYQGWEAITDGSTVYYCITEDINWEVGYGVKTGGEIVRNLLSSNTGSLLSLDGKASVFCTYPSEKAVFLNADDNIYFPSSNVTANNFVGKGNGITNINADANNLAPEAPTDGETYARNNATWVSIAGSSGIPDAPVDGLMYGRRDGEWDTVADASDVYTKTETNTLLDAKADKATTYTKTQTNTLLDSKANVGDSYTKAETYNNTEIDSKLFEKADKTTTYTKAEIDSQQLEQDAEITANTTDIETNTGNISSNTTAIGTLSGQVAQNSEDIGELQDSIFFTSAYSADYPSAPNRDPEDGNMYLQNVALFTYSYAEATQIFVSKTDESGNVRQFTAVQAGDSIVLNQVESPNYGRYELVSIEDVSGSYVVMNVIPKLGEGTVIEGVKIAFQAFPKPGTGDSYTKAESDAIDDAQDVNISANTTAITTKVGEAPVDGKQYGRKDATWTEVTGGGTLDIDALPALPTELKGTDLFVTERTGTNYKVTADGLSIGGSGSYTPEPLVWETVTADRAVNTVYTNTQDVPLYIQTYVLPSGASQMVLELDGLSVGGAGGSGAGVVNAQLSTLVPVGSTYAIKVTAGTGSILTWQEARMPVAVGGGSGWEETVLYDNPTGALDFSLSESYDNFDYLRFDSVRTDSPTLKRSDLIPTSECARVCISGGAAAYMYPESVDKINYTTAAGQSTYMAIFRVVGINTGE